MFVFKAKVLIFFLIRIFLEEESELKKKNTKALVLIFEPIIQQMLSLQLHNFSGHCSPQ